MNAVFNRTISPEKKIPKFGQFYFDSCLARGKFFCLETGMSTAYETIKTSDRCLLCRRVMTWEQWLDREQQCRPCPSLCQEGPAAVSQSRPVCLGLLVGVGPSLGTLSSHPKFFQSTWRTSFSPPTVIVCSVFSLWRQFSIADKSSFSIFVLVLLKNLFVWKL